MKHPITVFVCGTYSDLSAERGAVLDAIQRLQLGHHSMEFFGARPERPIETCLSEVSGSDIIVTIVGDRYGSLIPGQNISYSQAEYEEAYRLGKRCLVYMVGADENRPDEGPDEVQALARWKAVLKDRHTVPYFKESSKLAVQVAVDLGRELNKIEADSRSLATTAEATAVVPNLGVRFCKRFGDEARQLMQGVASDTESNILLIGDLWGNMNFGGDDLRSVGDRDIFLAKFDRTGKHVWSKRYGDRYEQVGRCVATDHTGSIFVGSSYAGVIDFGGARLTSKGRYNVALAKLDKAGRHVWSQSFGDNQYHVLECLAVAPSGNVTIAGHFRGSINFGLGTIGSQSAQADIFVATFSSEGQCIWAKRVGGPYEQQSKSVAIDCRGNVVLAGLFKGNISIDAYTLREPQPDDYCGFVLKLDEHGRALWCKRVGDPPAEQGWVVAFDRNNGDVLFAGLVRNKLPTKATTPLCVLARYDGSGILQWSRTIAGVFCQSLDVSADGQILFTGYFNGTIDFGLGPITSAGGNDIVVAMLTSQGSTLWAKTFGDERQQFLVRGIHGHNGSIVLAGSFHGTIDFGAGKLVAAGYDGKTEGTEDVFLAILDSK